VELYLVHTILLSSGEFRTAYETGDRAALAFAKRGGTTAKWRGIRQATDAYLSRYHMKRIALGHGQYLLQELKSASIGVDTIFATETSVSRDD
jgi:hypothetical protein